MENEYQAFDRSFREICRQSCSRLAYEREQTDAEYATASRECSALYEKIREKLGEEHKLINKFDAAKNRALGFGDEFIYQQGFQDCVYLLRWVGLL